MLNKRIVKECLETKRGTETRYKVQTLKRRFWLFGEKIWITDTITSFSNYCAFSQMAIFDTIEQARRHCGLQSCIVEQKVIIDNIKYNEKTKKGDF